MAIGTGVKGRVVALGGLAVPPPSRPILATWAVALALLTVFAPVAAAQSGPLRGHGAPAAPSAATPDRDGSTGDVAILPPESGGPTAGSAVATAEPTARADSPEPVRSARPRGRSASIAGSPTQPAEHPPAGAPRDERATTAPSFRSPAERNGDRSERGRDHDRDRPVSAQREQAGDDPRRTDEAAAEGSSDEPSGERVWPLRAGSFDFTQAFGCVPQLGGFYQDTPGCPGETPGFHSGIDLGAPTGTRFYAAASGWVRQAGLDRDVGLANTRIVIQHDGGNADYATEYLHWLTTYVEPGEYVRAGQPIGEVGSVGYSTGPHLHFSVIDFDSGEHLDPSAWLPRDRANGSYLGLRPGSRETTFDDAPTRKLPDYADPAPPPLPRRQRLPASPPDVASSSRANRAEDERPDRNPDAGGDTGGDAERDPDRRDRRRDRAEKREARDERRAEADTEGAEGSNSEDDTPRASDPPDADEEAVGRERESGERRDSDRDRHADAPPADTANSGEGNPTASPDEPTADANPDPDPDRPRKDRDREQRAPTTDEPAAQEPPTQQPPAADPPVDRPAQERPAKERPAEARPSNTDGDGSAERRGGERRAPADDGKRHRDATKSDRSADEEGSG